MSPANPTHFQNGISVERDEHAIRQLISAHNEWFVAENSGAPLGISANEFDFSVVHRRLLFSCWTESGSRTWRIIKWNWNGEKLQFQASRRMGAEISLLELVPRASAKAIVAGIAVARQERCERLAQIAAQTLGVGFRGLGVDSFDAHPTPITQPPGFEGTQAKPHTQHPDFKDVDSKHLHPIPNTQHSGFRMPLSSVKIERATLSPGMRRDQPGRYARIVLRLPHERIAVTGTVAQSDVRNVDSLFSSALLWFQRITQSPKRPGIEKLFLVVEQQISEGARQRHVMLRDSLRQRIELFEIDEDWKELAPAQPFERKHLWRKRLARFPPVNESESNAQAIDIIANAPQAIDVVASRHGQTLRYHGLPFARVRRVLERDRIWFGIEGSRRRVLDDFHRPDWAKLFQDLETYRNKGCRDRRHWLYRASGEAWLESILRRDITKLDPGLIIAPLHAQFRTSHGGPTGARPIDLLALRHDGRLVVIELKVTEDREHVFQGVDYWRRVEAHRRRGHIASAKLFGEREISDESPLVYLVAPTLRFHPSFHTLAKTIAPDIEIYRFDINEDWRAGVRVVRRDRVNG